MTGQIGVDTTLLIDFFKGEERAVDFVRENATMLVVTELVIYEFLCGNITEKEQQIFLAAMQSFPTTVVDRNSVLLASKMFRAGRKAGTPLGHQDVLIAASYAASGITQIATRNVKHFSLIKEITVRKYA